MPEVRHHNWPPDLRAYLNRDLLDRPGDMSITSQSGL